VPPFLCELFLPEGLGAPSALDSCPVALPAVDSSAVLPLRLVFLSEVLLLPSEVDCPLVPCVISSPFGHEEAGDGLANPCPPRVADFGDALSEALGDAAALGRSAGGGGLFIEFAFVVVAPVVVLAPVVVVAAFETPTPAVTPNAE